MALRILPINEVTPGMRLYDAVLDEKGKILLATGSILTNRAIDLLYNWKVQQVSILIGDEDDDMENSRANTETPANNTTSEQEIFLQRYNISVQAVSNLFQSIRQKSRISVAELQQTAMQVYTHLTETEQSMTYLLRIKQQHATDVIAHHSTMVAYLAGIMARWMELSDKEVKIMTLSGLIHDIGKLTLLPDLINKFAPYTQEEAVLLRSHVIKGVELLRGTLGIPQEVLLAVYQHHERMDGNGYPMGVKSRLIHPYARIVAVADVFYNETYQEAGQVVNPFPVIERLSREMFDRHDPAVIHPFLRHMHDSLLGNSVLLSDGRPADIIYFHQNKFLTPLVRTKNGEVIDLSTVPHLNIAKIYSEAVADIP